MNRSRQRVLLAQALDRLGELRSRSIRSRPSEVASRPGLYRAEDVGRSTAFVLAVPLGGLAGLGGYGRTDFGMKWYRLFTQAHHWFLRNIRLFVQLQQILHLSEIGFIHLRHAPHFFPATASGRGLGAACGLSPDPREEPAFSFAPAPRSTVRSSGAAPWADFRTPSPRSFAAAFGPITGLSLAAALHTALAPGRLRSSGARSAARLDL